MAQYLLSVWHDGEYELDFSGDAAQRQVAQVAQFNADLELAGAMVFACGLQPVSSATVVQSVAGDVSMTDGPYAKSSAQMGGFWIIEAPNLEAALEWASQATAACETPVEVRPLQGE